jgi:hypothetical protein
VRLCMVSGLVMVLLLSIAKALTVCPLLSLSMASLCSRHREPDVFIVAYGKLEVCITHIIVIDTHTCVNVCLLVVEKVAMFNVQNCRMCVDAHTVLACLSIHTALILYCSQLLSVGTYPTALEAADFELCTVKLLLFCLACNQSPQLYTALYKDGEPHTTSDDATTSAVQHIEQSNTDDSNTTSNCAGSGANKVTAEAAAEAAAERHEHNGKQHDDTTCTQYRIRSFSDAESEKLLLCSKTVSNQSI